MIPVILISVFLFAQKPPDDYSFKIDESISMFSPNTTSYKSSLSLEPDNQSFTVYTKIIPDNDIETFQIIASKGNEATDKPGWMLAIGDGKIGFRVCELRPKDTYSAAIQARIPKSITANPIYVAAVVNRRIQQLELYINGSKLSSYSGAFNGGSKSLKNIEFISSRQAPLVLGVEQSGLNY